MKRITNYGIFYENEKGQFHRENNMPSNIYNDGVLVYYVNNKRHRTDGPAYFRKNDNYKEYYLKGEIIHPEVIERLFFRQKRILIINKIERVLL